MCGVGEGEIESVSDIEVNGKPISEIKDLLIKYTPASTQTTADYSLRGSSNTTLYYFS